MDDTNDWLTAENWRLVLEWVVYQRRYGVDTLDALRWLVVHFYLVAAE